jgi:hypothetical protein
MTTSNHHWDVGAYALGVLDPPDAERFEEHLVLCTACADDLESMLPVTELLSHVDVGDFTVAEAKPTGFRGMRTLRTRINVRSHERVTSGQRRIPVLVAGLILVALMGVSYVAGTRWGAPADANAVQPPASVAAGTGEVFESVRPATGVRTRVSLTGNAWGTGMVLTLSGVRGPLVCELVAVDATGRSTVALSWSVPEAGYGTQEQPEPLILHGATAVPRDDITRLEIRATDTSGYASTLAILHV